jgi:hypothetical protein
LEIITISKKLNLMEQICIYIWKIH